MSRIDDALKVAEGDTPTTEPKIVLADQGVPLSQYRQEAPGPRPHARETPPPLRPVERRADAAVPSTTPAAEARSSATRRRAASEANMQARLVTGNAHSVSLEQYRRLAAVLHEEQADAQLKTVMVTSAVPDEGKTLTTVNIALTLSESYGRRVLVIDADLRRPALHRTLGVSNDRGLSEALLDGHDEAVLAPISRHLSVLTAGQSGSNPLAGLTSGRMSEMLRDYATRFDWVILDTAPVGVLPDAQVLARLVGGVILVIGAGTTPAAAVERAVAELGGPDTIVGTVLNRVDEHRIPDAGYYGRYFAAGGDPR
jgi:capsular exopolysaccharide synthesis family protein